MSHFPQDTFSWSSSWLLASYSLSSERTRNWETLHCNSDWQYNHLTEFMCWVLLSEEWCTSLTDHNKDQLEADSQDNVVRLHIAKSMWNKRLIESQKLQKQQKMANCCNEWIITRKCVFRCILAYTCMYTFTYKHTNTDTCTPLTILLSVTSFFCLQVRLSLYTTKGPFSIPRCLTGDVLHLYTT